MRTIIAGGRYFNDYVYMKQVMDTFRNGIASKITVVSGTARGSDQLGEQWAHERNVKATQFPADWDQHGKSAGYIRNEEMADYADALVAFWDGTSKGTKHMIDIALRKGLLVQVVRYDPTQA